jgi:molybdenum cofactor biosynthesis enzyme MoaA
MGGESFVLPNLHQYVYVASSFANEVRITTNGSLITREKLLRFKKLGLTGINISVASIKKYKEITNSKYDWPFILDKIKIAQEIFPDTARINMALCKENMFGEIKEMIHFFVSEMKLNVTICEDVLETYKALDDTEGKLGAKIVEDSGYGLVFLEHEGKRFGYYSHKDNYKNTDFILSPIGHFIAWNEYCQKVGLNYDNKD